MPGHASSIAVAYPDLMSAPGPYRMEREWGVHKPTLDPTRDEVYQFVDTIVGELAAIFPDPICTSAATKLTPVSGRRRRRFRRLCSRTGWRIPMRCRPTSTRSWKRSSKHQRQMVGWDEIYHPSLPRSIVIQSWQGQDSLGASAQDGYQGILSTGFYLDQPQSTAYHYRNEILPQPLGVETAVQPGEQAQSWRFSMPRLKGSAVEGSFTLIEGKQGWRGFIDFNGKSRRAVHDIVWRTPQRGDVPVDTWMGDTRPVFTLQQDKLSGYTLVGNVRYPPAATSWRRCRRARCRWCRTRKAGQHARRRSGAVGGKRARAAARSQAVAARLRGGRSGCGRRRTSPTKATCTGGWRRSTPGRWCRSACSSTRKRRVNSPG